MKASLSIEQAFDQAVGHHRAGRLREAEPIYREILARHPENAGSIHHLGIIAFQMGRKKEALDLFGRALALDPNLAEAHSNLGMALRAMGQFDAAIAACRRAIALNPKLPGAFLNLGNALKDSAQLEAAVTAYRGAIAIQPNYADAYSELGNALQESGKLEEAIAAYGKAIALRPGHAEDHSNLGNALRECGQLGAAIAACRAAIAIRPDYAEAHTNLALALLHRNLAEGWVEYEWRLKTRAYSSLQKRFSQPLWDGGDLNGRTILLHAEQGIGETIQFIRYVPMIERLGGRQSLRDGQVFVEVQTELIALLRQLPGPQQWIARGRPLPAFDVHFPLPSLPRLFTTTLETIPAQLPPLRPDAELIAAWKRRLGEQTVGLKVGLNWAGDPKFKGDRTRSITLDHLAALAQLSGVTFYSLQKGPAAPQADRPPAGLRLVNLGPELRDFADTAAVMCLMDLVITTDTSVAHLAGAMGRPVWVMLQFMPDWRWLLDRADSPWYPSMRLFRQTSRDDWAGVISRVALALTWYPRQGP